MSQIQDIAGCRVIVEDLHDQDRGVGRLSQVFERTVLIDRRQQPSHGYRAVHVIVHVDEGRIEVQVRTRLQQLWAEASEKLSDLGGGELKYGVGPRETLVHLYAVSNSIAMYEDTRLRLEQVDAKATRPVDSIDDFESWGGRLAALLGGLVEAADRQTRGAK